MNIHPIIDEPPSFPQTVLRLLTGSTHCCDWCEKRWIKVHRTGQLECRNRRCPYCGQYGMTDRVEIERRCGMIMGARHGHMTLTWLPDRGRHGTRSWVLATHDGDSIRRIRLSRNELGDLEAILQSIANEKKELRSRR